MMATQAVAMFLGYLQSTDKSRKTQIGYTSDLRNFQRFMEAKYNGPWVLEDTTPDDVEGFMTALKEGRNLGPATRNRILCCLRSFLKFCVRKGYCTQNAAEQVELLRYPKHERRYLTDEDAQRVLASIDHPVIRIAATTMYYTGMRVSECVALRMGDVDLERSMIHVIDSKGNKDRDIPIADKLLPLLQEYRLVARLGMPNDARFFATTTGRLSASYVNHVLESSLAQLDLPFKVTSHIFRHSFATGLLRRGVSLVDVQKLLGHGSIAVTGVYLHSNKQHMTEAVNTL